MILPPLNMTNHKVVGYHLHPPIIPDRRVVAIEVIDTRAMATLCNALRFLGMVQIGSHRLIVPPCYIWIMTTTEDRVMFEVASDPPIFDRLFRYDERVCEMVEYR